MANEESLNVMGAVFAQLARAVLLDQPEFEIREALTEALDTFGSLSTTQDMQVWNKTVRDALYQVQGTLPNVDQKTFFMHFTKVFEETAKLTKNKTILAHYEKIMQLRMKRAISASERRARVA